MSIRQDLIIIVLCLFFIAIFGMDLKTIKGKKHYIYDSEEEFHIYHPDYKNIKKWRDGREFDWVFTDDNCVVQILKRAVLKSHTNRKEVYVRTICGQRIIRDKRSLIGEISSNIYTFARKSPDKKKLSSREILFAKYVSSGVDVIDSYKKAFPTNNHEYAKKRSRELISTTRIQNMVKEEVQQALNGVGVTSEYLIERFKDIADLSERDTDKLRSLESLAKIAGLFESNTDREQLTVWTGFTPEQLNSIKGSGNAKVEAHIERKIEANKSK